MNKVDVLAERLDNHLRECAEQNQTVLKEIRDFRKEVEPIVKVWQAGGVAMGLIKIIALLATTVAAVAALFKFTR